MREILFRGRRLDNGEWAYGYVVAMPNTETVKIMSHSRSFMNKSGIGQQEFYSHEVDPATVGQFTGILDKNGKKIFEGDVVSDEDGQFASVEWFKSASQFLAEFGDGYDLQELGEWCTVVGSIHDNPEMLGGAE